MSNQILVKCTRSSRRDFGDTATMSVAATIDVKRSGKGTVCLFVAIHTAIQQYVSLRATRDARAKHSLPTKRVRTADSSIADADPQACNILLLETRRGLSSHPWFMDVSPLRQFVPCDWGQKVQGANWRRGDVLAYDRNNAEVLVATLQVDTDATTQMTSVCYRFCCVTKFTHHPLRGKTFLKLTVSLISLEF